MKKLVFEHDLSFIHPGLKKVNDARTPLLKPHPELRQWLLEHRKKQMASGHPDSIFPSDPKKA